MKNQEKHFNQLCVWPATIVKEANQTPEDFKDIMKENFDVKVKYETELKTNPDYDEYNNPIEGTGGRNDLLFYVHDEDVDKFAIKRLQYGIKWWEDHIDPQNGNRYLYDDEVFEKYPKRW